MRTSSRLLDLAPAGTKAWIGLPNLGANLDETQRVLDQKIAESPALQQWWNDVIGPRRSDAKFHSNTVLVALAEDYAAAAEQRDDGGPLGGRVGRGAAISSRRCTFGAAPVVGSARAAPLPSVSFCSTRAASARSRLSPPSSRCSPIAIRSKADLAGVDARESG